MLNTEIENPFVHSENHLVVNSLLQVGWYKLLINRIYHDLRAKCWVSKFLIASIIKWSSFILCFYNTNTKRIIGLRLDLNVKLMSSEIWSFSATASWVDDEKARPQEQDVILGNFSWDSKSLINLRYSNVNNSECKTDIWA